MALELGKPMLEDTGRKKEVVGRINPGVRIVRRRSRVVSSLYLLL